MKKNLYVVMKGEHRFFIRGRYLDEVSMRMAIDACNTKVEVARLQRTIEILKIFFLI